MKRSDLILLAVALVVATLFIVTGAARLPIASNVVLKHRPVFVYATPVMAAGRRSLAGINWPAATDPSPTTPARNRIRPTPRLLI